MDLILWNYLAGSSLDHEKYMNSIQMLRILYIYQLAQECNSSHRKGTRQKNYKTSICPVSSSIYWTDSTSGWQTKLAIFHDKSGMERGSMKREMALPFSYKTYIQLYILYLSVSRIITLLGQICCLLCFYSLSLFYID